jgi:hypothetical protein
VLLKFELIRAIIKFIYQGLSGIKQFSILRGLASRCLTAAKKVLRKISTFYKIIFEKSSFYVYESDWYSKDRQQFFEVRYFQFFAFFRKIEKRMKKSRIKWMKLHI